MLRRIFITGWILLIVCINAGAQSMDKYTNQLFFNSFTNTPDPAITGFLKLYLPALNTSKMPGTWVSYPAPDTLVAFDEIHSFVFKKHPHFSEKFTTGHVDFFCRRYQGAQSMQNITGVQLWLEFGTLQEAEIAFSRLVDRFIAVSSEKKISTINGAVRAAFINRKDTTGFTRVRLSMVSDAISSNKYKIIIETVNDL